MHLAFGRLSRLCKHWDDINHSRNGNIKCYNPANDFVSFLNWMYAKVLVCPLDGICLLMNMSNVTWAQISSKLSVCSSGFSWQRQMESLRWRHNGQDGVLNHQPHHCLLNRLFGCRSKKTSKLRVTGLCAGNSPGTGEFPTQMPSNAENVSIWWRHHDIKIFLTQRAQYYGHCHYRLCITNVANEKAS